MPPSRPRAARAHLLAERLAALAALDAPARAAAGRIRKLVGPGPLKDALSGRSLGHPVHPLLTDAVIGTWTSALLLDLLGGDRDGGATQRLIGLGLAAYLPTAAAGALDWADSEYGDDAVRRIGAAHAASNATAACLQAASLAARRSGARGRGVALSLAGGAALGAGGYLGAHLSYVRGIGMNETALDPGPGDWAPAGPADDLTEGSPVVRDVAGTPVLLVRSGDSVRAIHDRCSHRGCSLAEGRLDGDVIECGCHGSRFRLIDGGIERGPAFSPQPAFATRLRAGQVEVRPATGED